MAALTPTHVSKTSSPDQLEVVYRNVSKLLHAPEKFVSVQKKAGNSFTSSLKEIFDLTVNSLQRERIECGPLNHLLINGFDDEQIWQEIELFNDPSLTLMIEKSSRLKAKSDRITFLDKKDEKHEDTDEEEYYADDDHDDDDHDDDRDDDDHRGEFQKSEDDEQTDFENEEPQRRTHKAAGSKTSASVVDDQFFKLSEMERFLEMEDAREEKRRKEEDEGDKSDSDSEEEEFVDVFEEILSDEELEGDEGEEEEDIHPKNMKSSRQMFYADYFTDRTSDKSQSAIQRQKGVKFDLKTNEDEKDDDDDAGDDNDSDRSSDERDEERQSESDDENSEVKSSFERRQEKLQQRIEELENANLADKPWQMIGEVSSKVRPENSLLQEDLDFDVAYKPAPVITEETTATLESLIKQRILDAAWDDVERKIKPKDTPYEFKKQVTLDQEKSKLSLGEIYEQEYLKQMQTDAGEEEEDPAHTEIKKMMDSLFVKLDALSNFHFTPKPIQPEVKIITNAPAITMEEVQPVHVADAALLAPEEVQEKKQGELKGDRELTSTDRKRSRRKKKMLQKLKAKQRQDREKQKGITGSKEAALDKLSKASRMPSSNTSIIRDPDSTDKHLLKSSKKFFEKLHQDVAMEVKGYRKSKTKIMKDTALQSKKLKL